MKKRLLVVDEHAACRQMMMQVLRGEEDYEVVGDVGNGHDALTLCERYKPDILILELMLPGLCGKEVLRRARQKLPNARVLLFTGTRNQALVIEALRLCPNGFVDKRDSLSTFLEALRAISAGRSYFAAYAASLLSEVSFSNSLGLTLRETEVLQLVAESWSSKEIATRLEVATKTVENHRAHIMRKLGVRDTAAMTLYAVRSGLVA